MLRLLYEVVFSWSFVRKYLFLLCIASPMAFQISATQYKELRQAVDRNNEDLKDHAKENAADFKDLNKDSGEIKSTLAVVATTARSNEAWIRWGVGISFGTMLAVIGGLIAIIRGMISLRNGVATNTK